jgi:hypothetical protein
MFQVFCHELVIPHPKDRFMSFPPAFDPHWILAEGTSQHPDRKNQRKKQQRQNNFGHDSTQSGAQGEPEYCKGFKKTWTAHGNEQKEDR